MTYIVNRDGTVTFIRKGPKAKPLNIYTSST